MNLRTLKKLSKRAAPLLPLLGDTRQQFRAEPYDNYGVPLIRARKHWDRSNCHPTYEGRNDYLVSGGAQIVFTSRAGHRVLMRPPSHPRKGTMMVGGMSGYYEPEWDEDTAYRALLEIVREHFTDYRYDPETDDVERVPLRSLPTPSEVFKAASEIIAQPHSERVCGR